MSHARTYKKYYFLYKDTFNLVHWQRVYTSHLSQSGQPVQYLDSNWSKYRGLQQNPEFQETIQAFQDYNISATHKDDIGLCRDGCAALLAKMAK